MRITTQQISTDYLNTLLIGYIIKIKEFMKSAKDLSLIKNYIEKDLNLRTLTFITTNDQITYKLFFDYHNSQLRISWESRKYDLYPVWIFDNKELY